MATFKRYLTSISSTIGLWTIANLGSIDSVRAFQTTFTNSEFESSFSTGWTTTGDASRQGTFQTISPPNGILQLMQQLLINREPNQPPPVWKNLVIYKNF
jgi:hypothetical protein